MNPILLISGASALFFIIALMSFVSYRKKVAETEALLAENAKLSTILEEREKQITEIKNEMAQRVSELKDEIVNLEDRILLKDDELRDKIEKLSKAEQKNEIIPRLEADLDEKEAEHMRVYKILSEKEAELEGLKNKTEEERKGYAEKLKLLEEAKESLKEQFENIANKIFDEKNEKFRKESTENIANVLNPFKEGLDGFKKRVEEMHFHTTKEREGLKVEITKLAEMNTRLSKDADNLTKALKGDSKIQGGWGEIVLDKLLQSAGLREGFEYVKQENHKSEEGKNLRPDIIVHLPDNKDIIVDSKVSLTAYERFYSAETDKEREEQLKMHLTSIKAHVKGLSEKNYQNLKGVNTVDYVFMFIPIEGAYTTAVEKDPELIREAFEKNIMITGPANLLASMKVVHTIWKYELQNQNAVEIAEKAGQLHDKFVVFVNEFLKIEERLKQAQESFDGAKNKLTDGKGNVMRRFEILNELGVKSKKDMPELEA